MIFFVTLIFTFLQGCRNENMTTKVLVLPRSYMNCYFCYTGDITGLGYEKLGLNTCGDFGPDDRSHLKMCSPGQTCKQCLTMLDNCEAQARVRQGKARKGKERQGWRKVKGLKA